MYVCLPDFLATEHLIINMANFEQNDIYYFMQFKYIYQQRNSEF